MSSCLIVGGDSPLGAGLAGALAARNVKVIRTSRRRTRTDSVFLDLSDPVDPATLPPAPMIALVAAETRFSACTDDPVRSRRINVEAPTAIARQAAERGCRVLFFSSIAVHDGSVDRAPEDAPVHPNTLYGKQKRETEENLLDLGANVACLRLSKVIGPAFPLFLQWRRDLAAGKVIEPFSDMAVAPVSLDCAVDAAVCLLTGTEATGIFQLSARDQVSYADLAWMLARQMGADRGLVRPVRAADRLDPATLWLPAWARMSTQRLEKACGIVAPDARAVVQPPSDHGAGRKRQSAEGK